MYWILNQSYFWRHLLGVAYNAYDIFAEMFVGVYRNVCLFVIIIKILTIDDTAWDDITRGSFEDESVDPKRHDTCALEGRRRPGKLSRLNQSCRRSQSPGNYWRSWSSDGAHTSHETSNGTDACLPASQIRLFLSCCRGRTGGPDSITRHETRDVKSRSVPLGFFETTSPESYLSLSRAGPTPLRQSGERRWCAFVGIRESVSFSLHLSLCVVRGSCLQSWWQRWMVQSHGARDSCVQWLSS